MDDYDLIAMIGISDGTITKYLSPTYDWTGYSLNHCTQQNFVSTDF